MTENITAELNDRFARHEAEVGEKLQRLAERLIDAPGKQSSDKLFHELQAIARTPDDLAVAVGLVKAHREYCRLCEQTRQARRRKLPAMHQPADVLRKETEWFTEANSLLTASAKLDAGDATLTKLQQTFDKMSELANAAQKTFELARGVFEDPIAQARGRVSAAELAADKFAKLKPPETPREVELLGERKVLTTERQSHLHAIGVAPSGSGDAIARIDSQLVAERDSQFEPTPGFVTDVSTASGGGVGSLARSGGEGLGRWLGSLSLADLRSRLDSALAVVESINRDLQAELDARKRAFDARMRAEDAKQRPRLDAEFQAMESKREQARAEAQDAHGKPRIIPS